MKTAAPFTRPVTGSLRVATALFPFLAAMAVVAGIHHKVADRLTDPLATHFDIRGKADGFTSVQGFLTGTLLILVLLGAGSAVFVGRKRPAPAARWVIGTGWGIAATVALPTSLTLLANAHADRAESARLPLWELAAVLAAGVAAGALGWLLAGPEPRPQPPRPGAAPRLALGAGERAGWTRTVGSPLLSAVGLLTVCGGLFLGITADWFTGGVLLASGAAVGAVTSVRVTVDRRGLALAPALLPYAFRRVPFDRVAEATSRNVHIATEFGGWGYRVRHNRSGLVLRSGEGLVLRLHSGREFVVTVDDAATAAALFNTYLDRARPSRGD
ncbi:DUF1648 domain-containing protein [Streptomyces pinistramenti]|uniref:DUF1648 domain-containing protein n=1 Tax=Streptomyces pinistramenti TaxID=2884812 RepID=UPI001D07AD2D|nr:DUF1648 domain-containing protein [Streptomyces pinistramenti]MCB5906579.1 DUF1648 domain-containing protein [Streptomyces pinistramenti]